MAYERTVWRANDLITADKLNNIEERLDDIDKLIGEDGSSSESFSERIENNTNDIADIQDEIDEIKTKNIDQDTNINQINNNNTTMNTEIKKLKSFSGIFNDAFTSQGAVKPTEVLKTRIDSIENTIKTSISELGLSTLGEYKGIYSSEVSYNLNDIVSYTPSSGTDTYLYYCKKVDEGGSVTNKAPTNTAYWKEIPLLPVDNQEIFVGSVANATESTKLVIDPTASSTPANVNTIYTTSEVDDMVESSIQNLIITAPADDQTPPKPDTTDDLTNNRIWFDSSNTNGIEIPITSEISGINDNADAINIINNKIGTLTLNNDGTNTIANQLSDLTTKIGTVNVSQSGSLATQISSLRTTVNNYNTKINQIDVNTQEIADNADEILRLEGDKIKKPTEVDGDNRNGQSGQVLVTNGDGTTTWEDKVTVTDAQAATAFDTWVTNNPDTIITTELHNWLEENAKKHTIENGSITDDHISSSFKPLINTFIINTLNELLSGVITITNGTQTTTIDIPFGHYVKTLGFYEVGDNGGGLYYIEPPTKEFEEDRCAIFRMRKNGVPGNWIRRIFDEPFVYLESLNLSRYKKYSASYSSEDGYGEYAIGVSMATINKVIDANNIEDVRCGSITTDQTITIGNYNFTFDKIYYTGNEYAIKIDNVTARTIRGNVITARNEAEGFKWVDESLVYEGGGGSGIGILTTTGQVLRNKIQINFIEANKHGMDIIPSKGRGIMHNQYVINKMNIWPTGRSRSFVPTNTNLSDYAPDVAGIYIRIYNQRNPNTGKLYYSWEGEDHFSIGDICASNSKGATATASWGHGWAKGVSIILDSDNIASNEIDNIYCKNSGVSSCGTITGITFDKLATEYSDIGVYMRCGTEYPFDVISGQEPGIKSVYINNYRNRENGRSRYFIDAIGYFRDVYIKPTAVVSLPKWCRIWNTSQEQIIIDGPVIYGSDSYRSYPIGYKLIATRKLNYIKERIPTTLQVFDKATSNVPADALYVEYDETNKYYFARFPVQVQGTDPDQIDSLSMPDRFSIRDDLGGEKNNLKTIRIRLDAYSVDENRSLYEKYLNAYFYNESAKDIKVSVPAYCKVQLLFARGSWDSCTITNDNAKRNDYSVSIYRLNNRTDNNYVIYPLTFNT